MGCVGARWSVVVALGLAGALGAPGVGQGQASGGSEGGVAVVYLGDGTSVPLLDWRFSYEYKSVPRGASRGLVKSSFSESRELWLGKHALDVAGRTLELRYKVVEVERIEGTETVTSQAAQVGTMIVVGPGDRKRELKPEGPRDSRLRSEADKGATIFPVMLDLKGRTLAGTQRRFCLAAFHALVECRPLQGDRVMRVVFPDEGGH